MIFIEIAIYFIWVFRSLFLLLFDFIFINLLKYHVFIKCKKTLLCVGRVLCLENVQQ